MMTRVAILCLLLLLVYFNDVSNSNVRHGQDDGPDVSYKVFGAGDFLLSLRLAAEVSSSTIEVTSMGRIANLGDLYDIRSDRFLEINLLETLRYDAVTSVDHHSTDTQIIRLDNYSEKFNKLSVEDSQRMSFLAGLLKLSGSAKYLQDHKSSKRSAKSSVLYSTFTKRERLNILSTSSREELIMDLLDMIDATHVVIAIEWGARVVLSVEDPNTDNANAKHIKGNVDVAIDMIGTSIKGDGGVTVDENLLDKSRSLSFRMIGDISFANNIPNSITTAIQLMQQVPSLVKQTNHGKGKQLALTLLPVDTLRRVLKRDIKDNTLFKSVDKELVNSLVKDFDDIQSVLRELNDLREDVTNWKSVLPTEIFNNVTDIYNNLTSSLLTFRTEFSAILVQVRSGLKGREALVELRQDYISGPNSPQKVVQMLHDFDTVNSKITRYQLFASYGSRFIGRNSKLDNILASNFETELRVLYFDSDFHNLSSDLVQIFLHNLKVEQAKKSIRIAYYFRDTRLEKERLTSYRNGKIIVYNLIDTSITSVSSVTTVVALEKREYVLVSNFDGHQTAIVFDPKTEQDIMVSKHFLLGGSVMAVVGNILYLVGGGLGRVKCISTLNLLKSSFLWEECGDVLTDAEEMSGNALTIGHNVYFLGNSGKFWEFNTKTNTTKQLSSFGGSNSYLSLVELNGVIYGYYDFNLKYLSKPDGTWESLSIPGGYKGAAALITIFL